jgi:hypothetical protein
MQKQQDFLNQMIRKVLYHQRICDKNMFEGNGDELQERMLKSIFISFEFRIYKFWKIPGVDRKDIDQLATALGSIAQEVVNGIGYKDKAFALMLIERAIDESKAG